MSSTPEIITDPVESAKAARLRYVTDDEPGIERKAVGKGFSYFGPDGQVLRDESEVERINALAIPPAWTEVWICKMANGHLQATGRDARGRKQYRYHPRWREVRDETKYNRMALFGQALPVIRERVETDLARSGIPREKVLATVVKLLDRTSIRIGNKEYARDNGSFGLTTMRDRHVDISGSRVQFEFTGKSGKKHSVAMQDRRVARIIRRCRDLPGYELFQYLDDSGQRHRIGSSDVNQYLKEITGEDFTAKDFRTWAGTAYALLHLCDSGPAHSESEAKKAIVEAIKATAEQLGNTPAICRKCYVHPAVLKAYEDGSLFERMSQALAEPESETPTDLFPEESVLMALIANNGG